MGGAHRLAGRMGSLLARRNDGLWEGRDRRSKVFRTNTLSSRQYIQYFFFSEAVFGFFGAEVEFQEDVDEAVVVNGPFHYGFKEVEGIYRLDKVNVREDKLEFVGLEVTYEVPLDV